MSSPGRALVVGLGQPDRGDDAVGLVVARQVAALIGADDVGGIRVLETDDAAGLLDHWPGHRLVVVVDAVCSGARAGTLHLLETGDSRPALAASAWRVTGRGGTHALGLATVLELARALQRLPERLVLVGVEAAGFEHGAALSAPVSAAVGPAVVAVTEVLGWAAPSRPEGVSGGVPGGDR